MYVLSAIATALIVLHVAWYQLGWGWASFYSSVSIDFSIWLVFGIIFFAFVLTYIDLVKTTKLAEEKVLKGIVKQK